MVQDWMLLHADGFWGSRFERAFFNIRVFNPFIPSNQRSSLQACCRNHENVKKRAYDQCIREVEHGTFSPLVVSCTGGMGRVALKCDYFFSLQSKLQTLPSIIYTTAAACNLRNCGARDCKRMWMRLFSRNYLRMRLLMIELYSHQSRSPDFRVPSQSNILRIS